MKKHFIFFLILISAFSLFSQRGKDGSPTIASSTVVNVYTSLSANAFIGNLSVTVASAAGFATGDLIYIIQLQGASTNCVPEGVNPNNSLPMSDDFGRITNYNNAGNNEYAQVSSVAGNVITIDCPLQKNYTAAGKVQVIRVARFASLVINAGGIITCPQWNGTTGGVIAIEVNGNTTINGTGRIDANSLGFRGGLVTVTGYTHAASTGANNWGHLLKTLGMYKGESIVGDTLVYQAMAAKFCKGAIGNGGGGGNEVNGGGGGGANAGDTALWTGKGNPDNSLAGWTTAWNLESAGFAASSSSGGGRGGYSYAGNGLNPVTVPPGTGNGWAGDNRRPSSCGLGGRPLDYTTGRLFVGGGGGAGDEDNAYGGAGANGGGIINILSYGTIGGTGSINANGGNGNPTKTPATTFFNTLTGKDGAGGAGGGGAIKINSTGAVTGIAINAIGGNGGNQEMRTTSNAPDAYGPGGGGGGGYIGANVALPPTNVAGGNNGIVIYIAGANSCLIDNNFPPNGATKGGAGIATATLGALPTITSTPSATICVNNTATLTASTTGTGTIGWYTQTAGGIQLGTGTVFTSSVFTVPGTYTIFSGFCPDGIYRNNSIITVITGPTLTVNSPSICAGQTVTLTGTGATTYTWNTGPTTATIAVSPTSTTTYTISGTVATCSANLTSTVTVTAAPSITAAPVSICNGQTTTITASGATTYTWNTGPTTASIAVSPTTTTNYTVTGSNGACSSIQTTTVTVSALPSVTSTSATICSGQSTTLTAGGAATYTWNTGPTTATIALSPTVTTNYTVTGSNGTCSNTQTTSVIVNSLPSVTSTSATICAGQSTTLTAGGAATYTWNTGPTTATIALSPTVTTNYTVTGNNGTCSNTKTTTIIVNSLPSVTSTSATICSGQSTTLTAGGAATYTWNTGPTTTTIAVSPTVTTNYTVTGNNGACSNTQTTTVIVNSLPSVTSTSATICAGQSTTLTAGGAATYTWNTGPTTTTIAVSPTVTTNYTVTGSNGTCSNSQTASIVVAPSPTVTASSGTICSGQQLVLTAGGATTYTWNTGPTTTTIAVTPTTTTNYTVTGSNGSCSNTQTTSVIVNPLPVVTANSATLCSGQTATLIASGASTYTWNPGPLVGGTVTVSPGATQIYTVTGTSALACQGTNTTTVPVTATPTLVAPSATICPGNTATLTVSGAATYTWNPGGSTGTTFTASPPVTTVYTVSGTNGACTSTQTVAITIGSSISIVVNSPSICTGETATLTASGATTYTWSTGSNSTSITITPTATTVYTINGTSSACSGVNTSTVTVNTTPTVSTAPTSICSGQTATLTASGATTYTWNPGGLSGSSVTVSPTSTQNYTVIGSSAGCTNTAISNVSVTTSPTVVAQPMSICPGGTGTLTAMGASSYTWNPGNVTGNTFTASPSSTTNYTVTGSNGLCVSSATVDITVGVSLTVAINSATICAGQSTILSASVSATSYTWNTGANASTVVVTPTTTTSYTVDVTSPGCNGTGTTTVFVNALPTVTVNGAAICSGQLVTLTASGASNYTWTPSGVNGSTFAVAPSTSTTYSVIGETGGCTNIATADVTVTPTPSLTVNSPTICGGSATLIASGATNYTWSPGGQNTSSIVVSPSVTSFYTVDAANGACFTTTTTMVYVNSAPPLIITLTNPSPYCPGTCSNFSTTTGYSGVVFDYGDATGTTTATTHCYAAGGTYTVTAAATYSSGCSLVTNTIVNVSFLPIATATFDINGGTSFSVGTNVSFTSYSVTGNWSFGDGSAILTNTLDPSHIFSTPGNFCVKLVTITSTVSCADSIIKCLDIIQPVTIIIPNVFTPNGDGNNDVFKASGTGITTFHCIIFDRWGLRMYEWDGIGGGWDGYTKAGSQASSGTYYYIIEYKTSENKAAVVKGFLSLFKD